MSSTKIPVDQALLAQARRVLGTGSTRDTLERALSLAIQHETRREAVEAELSRFASGHYAVLRQPATAHAASHAALRQQATTPAVKQNQP